MSSLLSGPEPSTSNIANNRRGMGRGRKRTKMAKLGSGARFAALESKLAARPGVTNPGALAAYIGRKKYGAKKYASLSTNGRREAVLKRLRSK